MSFGRTHNREERLDRVAILYLAYKFFGALYFAYPIFYEYASRVIDPVQIGLFFAIIGICGLAAEIPTGIMADKYSRKVCALAGMAFLTIAPAVVFIGHSWHAYLMAALFYGVGGACISGALESLVYDHKNIGRDLYRRVNALEITCGQAGILVSAAAGGILFSVHQGLPFIAQAAAGLVCILLIAAMHEVYKEDHIKPTASHRQHFTQSVRHLLATPYLRAVVLMGVTFSVMLGMCIQLVNEAAMIEHGLDAAMRGLLISGAGIVTLIVLNLFLFRLLQGDIARIVYLASGAVIAYMLMGLGYLPLFLIGYLLWCCLNATSSFIRVLIQDSTPGSHRATILSSFKTLAVLVGLGGSAGTGLILQWTHMPRAAYLLFGAIALFVIVPCALRLVLYGKTPSDGM